jgi:hypothetical protein
VVAALLGDDAQPALDQRQVLAVLAEQQRGEPVVVEGEHDLGCGIVAGRRGSTSGPLSGRGRAQWFSPPPASVRRRRRFASVPNRLLVLISVIVTVRRLRSSSGEP